mgnify:CR=1 FL=1
MNQEKSALIKIKMQLDSLKSIHTAIKNVIERIEYLIKHSGINL